MAFKKNFNRAKHLRKATVILSPGVKKAFQAAISGTASPERVQKFVDALYNKAAKGRSATARRLLEAAKDELKIKVDDGIMKLAESPSGGVSASDGATIPMISNTKLRSISGTNRLYTAKEHKVTFTSGDPPGRWIKSCKVDNGEVTERVRDSVVQYHLSSIGRNQFIKTFGLNQKQQLLVDTNNFGFQASDITEYFNLIDYDTSLQKDQIAYGGVYKLNSYLTLTSLNRYLPIHVKAYLCRLKTTSNEWLDVMDNACNLNLITQGDGQMPLMFQQDATFTSDLVGRYIHVDPTTRGIKASSVFSANVDIIDTKRVKLGAGDRLKIKYSHLCKSGLRLDKLHGIVRSNEHDFEFPITYCLFLEYYGEECDAYRGEDEVGSENYVIKATSPGVVQYEFSKDIVGCRPSNTGTVMHNSGLSQGWSSEHFAIKLYSRSSLTSVNRRYYASYDLLNSVAEGGYTVPVMSDATPVDAGRML